MPDCSDALPKDSQCLSNDHHLNFLCFLVLALIAQHHGEAQTSPWHCPHCPLSPSTDHCFRQRAIPVPSPECLLSARSTHSVVVAPRSSCSSLQTGRHCSRAPQNTHVLGSASRERYAYSIASCDFLSCGSVGAWRSYHPTSYPTPPSPTRPTRAPGSETRCHTSSRIVRE